MKLTIQRTIYLLATMVLLTTAGCNKFLEEQDPSNLSTDIYYTLSEHAEAGIAAAYAQQRFISAGAGIFVQNYSMLEAVTGTAKTETGQNSDLNNLFGMVHNGDNLLIRNWWNGLFNVIAQTNLVLDRVPPINPMDEALKKKVLGEARFLRAWAYFYLVQLWGDVPLTLTPVLDGNHPDFYPPRTGTEAVYTQIIADLQEAENAGLSWTDPSGRASLGAVKSLLAKVYLAMAGFPLQKGASHYALAAAKANEVIGSSQFSLFQSYSDLHKVSMENRGEHIFEIQYLASVANANGFQQTMLPNFKNVSAFNDEIGSTVPAPEFYNSYEPGDRRTLDRVGLFYTHYYDGGNGALKDLSAPYIYKHFDSLAHGTSGVAGTNQSDLNWPQLLYSDILLVYAEASNEAVAGGPDAVAYKALADIRSRAGLTTPGAGTFSQAGFREAVWKERWYELCYNGITWFDMVRLRKAWNMTTRSFDEFVGYNFPNDAATLEQKHLLFPIPTEEIRNNPNLRPQNPGY
ncbi:MAG: RagB/SusD family nutrient uptake outer membrane protein [Candidatus Pseudobacter hemicellulosilyticus]|uniref:RagB/SusD family nutrient uptake outer membrane protein n=1 Tax=Candidatus Pseudobacter hemicellulosilyticus TaxID=3121375 RepID=A0AAJ5WRA9_9BACT|nr:MAG: RagB/SusD family nutrient uptake outer membrane protein [Pseudobacter sp.]